MFLGFAQFGKQLKNSKNNSKKQARKSNEINMEKSLKQHYFFINFHDFFSHEKCIDFFMHFSWKMGSKMEPKSMPKSYNNDFGWPKGRPGPIVNVFGSEKDGKKEVQKLMQKKGAKKRQPIYPNQSSQGRPGLHFEGLWGSLWSTFAQKWRFGRQSGNRPEKQVCKESWYVWAGWGGVPINLNGWKAPRP